jgi:hypothetical protein
VIGCIVELGVFLSPTFCEGTGGFAPENSLDLASLKVEPLVMRFLSFRLIMCFLVEVLINSGLNQIKIYQKIKNLDIFVNFKYVKS